MKITSASKEDRRTPPALQELTLRVANFRGGRLPTLAPRLLILLRCFLGGGGGSGTGRTLRSPTSPSSNS
eukprot:1623528-Pyramimonas_sp.AAC.1